MNDRILVEALRARDPGALAALYDSYAKSIYGYCWVLLGTPDGAQVALRDTLIAAEALIHSLRDPDRLRPWLYALARGECLRRRSPLAGSGPEQDEESADTDPGTEHPKALVCRAVRSLSPADREVLELTVRHGLSLAETAVVLGIGLRQAEALYETATLALRDAVTVEILARKGPHDCASRAEILAGAGGELTPEVRRHVIRHLSRCETCAPYRARQVSVEKVFGLLPVAEPPETLRVRVMSCFVDPDLLPYRRFVGRRAGRLDAAGFPALAGTGVRLWPRAVAGSVAATLAVTAVVLAAVHVSGEQVVDVALEAFPPPGEPPGLRMPWHPGGPGAPLPGVPGPRSSPPAEADPEPTSAYRAPAPAGPGGGQAAPGADPVEGAWQGPASGRPVPATRSPVPGVRPSGPGPGASPVPAPESPEPAESPERPAPSPPVTLRPAASPTAPVLATPAVPPAERPTASPAATPPAAERAQQYRIGGPSPGARPSGPWPSPGAARLGEHRTGLGAGGPGAAGPRWPDAVPPVPASPAGVPPPSAFPVPVPATVPAIPGPALP